MVSMKLWTIVARLPRSYRSWMAHHQGMSLLAICNLLFNDAMQEYFHAEPQVLATELLLHERVPNAICDRDGSYSAASAGCRGSGLIIRRVIRWDDAHALSRASSMLH